MTRLPRCSWLGRRVLLGWFVSGLLLAAAPVPGADWPQYRGSQAAGLAAGKPAPTSWNVETGENVAWKTPIPGLAHASPIVQGDRIYVLSAIGAGRAELKIGLYGDIAAADDMGPHQWRLFVVDRATGRVLFNRLAHKSEPRSKRHTKATHCNSTPATTGQRVVAILGSEGLFCFDRDGAPLWHTDLGPMDAGFFRSPSAQWGFGSSPVIHAGRVIVQCDVQEGSFLAAFDLGTGKEIWRTPREEVPTWCTPTVVEHAGRTQILVNGWKHLGGYDFETGAEIWKLNGGGDIPVPTPIVSHGLAYFTSAHGRYRPMRAVKLNAKGDITPERMEETNDSIAWVHPRKGNYMQTPIVVGELLYASDDRGILTCFEALTGEIHYSERLSTKPDGFTASPVSDGRNLYFTSEQGRVHVVPTGKEFSVLNVSELGESCLATPALVDGILFFRTRHHLVAVGH